MRHNNAHTQDDPGTSIISEIMNCFRAGARRTSIGVLVSLCAALAAIFPASAIAEAPPPFTDGGMSFQPIHGPTDPEEYSWTVELGHDQELHQIDEQHAEVFYNDLTPALSITAPPAHAADGVAVPTSLTVSKGDIVTLIVHHRAGNPAAAGAPFLYPIIGGYGWQGGLMTTLVPFDNRPPEEEAPAEVCLVPKLDGRTLKRAKLRLRAADCKVGEVVKLKGAKAARARVVRQSPRPGSKLVSGAVVSLTLARG